ncbi:MAG: hypothetical protein IT425_04635 [Pirellulales bacterium]|nr:hypothetical protein [Pirellulales bacterium]
MDSLNKSIAQLSELFRSMTPGARLTAGLLLAVVVVSVGYLFQHTTSGPDAFLFGGAPLSDGQLTRIEAAIAKAGLSGAVREGNRIRVPSGDQAKYVAAVADGDALPANFNTILEDALGKGGPWESREQTRERIKVAKEQTLSEIVRSMDWVENAVVLYNEQEARGMRSISPIKQMSASVSVQAIAGESLTPSRVKNIQKLVASAVSMQPAEVTVTNLGNGGVLSSEGDVGADIFEDGSLMHTKIAFESQKRSSILNALQHIDGVRVEVNADFNDTIEQETRSIKPDKAASAPSRTTETQNESTTTTTKGGGQPGPIAQGPGRQPASEPTQQTVDKTSNRVNEEDNVVSVEETKAFKKGYTLKEVAATVVVPNTYLEGLWKLRNPTANEASKPADVQVLQAEVRQNVENVVEPLLRIKENRGENSYKFVSVVFLDSLPMPAIEPPSMATKATSWLSRSWNTLAMLGVAMFSLLVLRSFVNSKGVEPGETGSVTAPTLALQMEETAAVAENDEEPEDNRPKLRIKKGRTIKDELVEMVRDDPQAAADILRTWISKPA